MNDSERKLDEIVFAIMVALMETFPSFNLRRQPERYDLLRSRMTNMVRQAYRLGREHEAASALPVRQTGEAAQ
jgi:hypothetical protein